jgi:hypothetical protein
MKKILTAVMALMMVLAMGAMAFAVNGDTFVPSITVKPAPEMSEIELIKDGETLEKVPVDCLLITPVADAMANKEDSRLPADAKSLLIDVYNKLEAKTMVLPESALKKAGLEPKSAIIRELLDVTWVCEENPTHMEKLQDPDVQLKITFKMKGLKENAKISVMTYKNDAWNPIAEVVNNGDETVTCTFDHLCPVAFVVGPDGIPDTGVQFDMELVLWACVLAVSAAALVVVIAKRRQNVA